MLTGVKAIDQLRDHFENWREWEAFQWFFTGLCILIIFVIALIGVSFFVSVGSGSTAREGDLRTQVYACDWNVSTKATQCDWQNTQYVPRGGG